MRISKLDFPIFVYFLRYWDELKTLIYYADNDIITKRFLLSTRISIHRVCHED